MTIALYGNIIIVRLMCILRLLAFYGNIGEFRVRDVPASVSKGETKCLHQQVQMFGRVIFVRCNIEAVQNIQCQQRCQALAVRWQFVNVNA